MAEDAGGERTEAATQRKLEEAREKGQVAISQELVTALMLCAAAGAILMAGGRLAETLGQTIYSALATLEGLGTEELEAQTAALLVVREARRLALPLAGLLAPILIMGLLAGYGQIGFQFSGKAIELDLTKLDPIKGFGRIFSLRALVRTGLGVAKILALGSALWIAASSQVDRLIRLGPSELGPSLAVGLQVQTRFLAIVLVAILALALIDFIYQRFQFDKDQRMTKQEVRQEHKNSEGDPMVKGRVRRIQREIATKRMMSAVPKATVVVTNPTHYAVALSYPRDADGKALESAPRVVAKGLDEVAQRIKALARESEVPLYEDVPLARSLHAQCEVGDLIPEELYAAVAAVLQQVWSGSKLAGQGTTGVATGQRGSAPAPDAQASGSAYPSAVALGRMSTETLDEPGAPRARRVADAGSTPTDRNGRRRPGKPEGQQ
jgi:flagellar biosynthesis protein FlhB